MSDSEAPKTQEDDPVKAAGDRIRAESKRLTLAKIIQELSGNSDNVKAPPPRSFKYEEGLSTDQQAEALNRHLMTLPEITDEIRENLKLTGSDAKFNVLNRLPKDTYRWIKGRGSKPEPQS